VPLDGSSFEQWQQDLLRAAELIDERGWWQTRHGQSSGECVLTSISLAVQKRSEHIVL
jgi:hypothetical protein